MTGTANQAKAPWHATIDALRGGLIVSCQAGPESPLNEPHHIAALAASAERGGAAGFRVDRPENVRAVRAVSALPILGINKRPQPGFDVFITPTFADAQAVVAAGADLVAIDGTGRERPDGEQLATLIARIHEECRVPVMADVATYEEGVEAAALGADLVATTIAGYTDYSSDKDGPALELTRRLADVLPVPVVVEGRIWSPQDVAACFAHGAGAVVVGSAITVPEFITRRLAAALPEPASPGAALAPAAERFFDELLSRLARLREDERAAIRRAADVCADAIAGGGRIKVFDTGHLVSHELVARTGGLVAFKRLELPADAPGDPIDALFDGGELRAGDVLVVGSVSGTGTTPVELAVRAREAGIPVIALTAPEHSGRLEPAHPSGRLLDVADVVLDNHAAYGDAFLTLPPLERELCPFSGIGAVALMWALTAATVERLLAGGIEPSVYRSIHLPDGPADVAAVEARYESLGH